MSVNNTQRALLANYLLGQGSSSTQGKNYVKNSMAINGIENVTANGTATIAKNTTTPLTGISDFAVTLPNSGSPLNYIEWTLDSLDRSLNGANCQLSFDYKITSIGSAVQGQVYIGGNLALAQTIPASPTTSTFVMNVPCGDLSGSTTVRLANATSNTGASTINIANVYYGRATNIGTVQQARLIGTVKITGCAGGWSTTSTTYATFATQAGCSYAVTGEALAPTTNIPAIRFASLPPGEYKLEYEGVVRLDGNNFNAMFQFFDGTNSAREESLINIATGAPLAVNGLNQSISYTSPQSNVTLQIRAKANSGGTAYVFGQTVAPGVIRVYHFPSASQQAVSSAQADYDWTSYTPTLSAGFGVTPTNVSFFHKRRGGDLIVKGTFTTGSVTAALGTISLPSGLTIDTTRTSINNLASANSPNVGMFNQSAANQSGPIVTATGSNTSVVYTGGQYSGSVTLVPTNVSSTMSSTAVTAINFTVPISGWNENQRAPTLVGSVTSNSSGAERIERAIIAGSVSSGAPASACTSSPCTIVSQSGNWLTSVTRAATGQYQLNIASGIFSAIPTCIPTSGWGGVISAGIAGLGGSFSSTAMGVNTTNITGTSPQDQVITVTCMGPR